ncbi:hypothetical protein OBK30_06955 [Empedobacter falsenii]
MECISIYKGGDWYCEPDTFETTAFMPTTLRQILKNNGWVKIENEEDLPKDYEISYHAWNSESDRDYYVTNMWTIINRYHLGNVTHYQPIEKPKPPIY